MQDFASKPPFSHFLKNNGLAFHPGYSHVTKSTVGEFCREALTSEYHPMGTCSMLPREEGGVVDTHLRVYGAKGLRVVAASVFPLQIRNNLQTCVYAVAERAADIIKNHWKESHGNGVKNGYKRGWEDEVEGKKNGKRMRRP
jgi:choline dehydrogenase